MTIDYWYNTFTYQDESVMYVSEVVHVLEPERLRMLTEIEDDREKVVVLVESEGKEKKGEELVAVIYFDFDRWNVKKAERNKIKGLDREKTYRIVGHACWIGSERYNLKLSLKRAKEVKRVMIEEGFKVEDVSFRGESECKLKRDLHRCRKVEIWQW